MKMDESRINANFLKYISRLERYSCYSQQMMDEIGEKIKHAPYGLSADSGGAYDGALVDVVLNKLCRMGFDLNKGGLAEHPLMMVNTDMLMRVLLLQHIGKAVMFTPQTEEWTKKKGWVYDFDNTLKSNLKLGERSLYLCQHYDIKVTDEEYEAIRIIDKEWDDKHIIMSSPLCVITRVANIMTNIELKLANGQH